MKRLDCVLCGHEHESVWGWKYRTWGDVKGWGCLDPMEVKAHEFVPERIKQDRKKYKKDILQPHREGYLSREYVETYPATVRQMIKDGSITSKEVKNAKYVWKDI